MKKLFRTMSAVLIAALLTAILTPVSMAATTLDTEQRSAADIKAYVARQGLNPNVGVTYSETPSIDAPGSTGAVDQKTKDAFIAAMNTVRYIAGLGEISWDSATQDDTMDAAILCAMNQTISHTPKKPAGVSDSIYNAGYAACESGNLYMKTGGYLSPLSSVKAWMHDTDAYNIEKLGHRRWCINPKMGKSSFGAINTNSGCYSVMSAHDKSNGSGTAKYVAWPAPNMPVEFFGKDQAWSISVPQKVSSSASVTVKRKSDNKTWNFNSTKSDGYFTYNNDGYGSGPCLIFLPDGITTKAGDVYDVTVSGVGTTIQYSVSFFNLGMNLDGTGDSTIIDGKSVKPERVPFLDLDANSESAIINWGTVTGADGYEVKVSTDNKNYNIVQTSSKTSYTIQKPDPNKAYYVIIRAYKQNGDKKLYGEYSGTAFSLDGNAEQLNFPQDDTEQDPEDPYKPTTPSNPGDKPTTPSNPNSKPEAPKTITAKSASYNSISLTWKAVPGAKGYEVQRSTNAKTGFKTIKTVSTAKYTDTKLTPGKKYYYKVRAYKLSANSKNKLPSPYTKVVTATPQVAAPKLKSVKSTVAKTAKAVWAPVAGANGYEVYYSTSKTTGFKKAGTIKTTSLTLKKLTSKKTYYVKVRAFRTVNGKKVPGAYSAPIKVKVK